MGKLVKNIFRKFLTSLLICLMILWVFSGWPQVWEKPSIPPKPQEIKAAPENLILFWDGADPPTGWTCISCAAGQDFYQVFPRGYESYGSATSGAATHTHGFSISDPSSVYYRDTGSPTGTGGPGTREPGDHSHVAPPSGNSITSASNNPEYQNLKIIRYDTGVPETLPAGVIGIFDDTPPGGWSQVYTVNKIIRGENSTTTGGSNTHTHTVTLGTTGPGGSQSTKALTGTGANIAGIDHTHAGGSSTTLSVSNIPPYITVILAKNSQEGTSLPDGVIALFNETPSSPWQVLSGGGGAFNEKFLMTSTTYGGTGGSATNTHANLIVTTGIPSATSVTQTGDIYTLGTHKHTFTITFNSTSSLPIYRNVIFAKYSPFANDPPQVNTVSLNASSTIVLSPNGTTSVSATTSVSDPQGCATISTTTAKIYREGVGSTCSLNNNNCYFVGSCSQDACLGNNATYTCTIAMEFFAEPTDEGNYAQSQNWHIEEWIALITVYDNQGASTTGSNEAVEEVDVQTLLAFDLSTTTINYGKVNPNETSTEKAVTISTIGNVPLDVNASGSDMTWNGNSIAVSWQHWSTTTGFNWDDGTALGATSTLIELESGKPTQRPTNATDDIYWKLKVPLDKQAGGPYEGTNIFIETQD